MKKFIYLLLLIYGFSNGFCQDSLQDNHINYPLNFEAKNNYQYLKSNVEDVNSMIFLLSEIGIERRLINKFSFRAGINGLTISPYLNGKDFITERSFTFIGGSLDLRYYPFSYANGEKQTNLSGMYVSVGNMRHVGIRSFDQFRNTNQNLNVGMVNGSYLDVGYQKRLFNIAYYNFGLKLAYLKGTEFLSDDFFDQRSNRRFYLIPHFNLGLALFKKKMGSNYFNYATQKSDLLKLNLFNFLVYNPASGHSVQGSYEKMINKAKNISIIGGLNFGFNKYNKASENDIDIFKSEEKIIYGNIFAESRYYYNLEKRKKAGKVGNGFSANYLALQIHHSLSNNYSLNISDQMEVNQFSQVFKPNLLYGIQRELGEHLYVDWRIGLTLWRFEKSNSNVPFELKRGLAIMNLNFGISK